MSHPIELPEGTPIAITVVRREPEPLFLSQLNCNLRGLDERRFLRMLRESDLPVVSEGHLRLVEAVAFDAYLRSRATLRKTTAPVLSLVDEEDAELNRSGLKRKRVG